MTVELIAAQFHSETPISKVSPLGQGHINDTFLVEVHPSPDMAQSCLQKHRFVLQRINRTVFPQPELVVQNMRTFIEHTQESLERSPMQEGRRWEIPQLFKAGEAAFYQDSGEQIWRAISFIENSRSCSNLETVTQAEEVGFALATFHRLVKALPTEQLADTLPGFHITPQYLNQFDRALQNSQREQKPELIYGLAAIEQRREWSSVLEIAKANGILKERVIHGDPKVNNILFEADGDQAIAFVDLDTVKPGLLHYDIGDCIRSGCNPLGGGTRDFDQVKFDLPFCSALLRGYLSQAASNLDDGEREYLFDSIRLLPFELALRYITDYLDGDHYFKTDYPTQNLDRAMVQFKLLESIEQQEAAIREAIATGLSS